MKPLAILLLGLPLAASPPLTFDNLPMGSVGDPLLMRTYLPDPGLDEAYFAHHGKGLDAAKYNPGSGRDVKGTEKPVDGFPAAIGVNFGPSLSYAFDTIECRLAYAWQGGFLDMYPYWGDRERGNRQSNNYMSDLVGILFYQAGADDGIHVNGAPMTSLRDPDFIGYNLEEKIPVMLFERGGMKFSMKITPEEGTPLALRFTLFSPDAKTLTWGPAKGGSNTLTHVLGGSKLASFQGFPRDLNIKKASAENGERLFASLGCVACHSLDGSLGHGPTLADLVGTEVEIEESKEPVLADAAYLLESIKAPSAKTVKGFPPNYMPPYALKDIEYECLVLFIQGIRAEASPE